MNDNIATRQGDTLMHSSVFADITSCSPDMYAGLQCYELLARIDGAGHPANLYPRRGGGLNHGR